MRYLAPGSVLNQIAGSAVRYPAFQVLVWNPNHVDINDVAIDQASEPPLDISPFVEAIELAENIGFENGDDPHTTQASFSFRRLPNAGINIRRGLIEDGVIVQIRQGDVRVAKEDWIPIFTGTFRGRPGDDPGTPAEAREGLQATAHGREERYLNLQVTTRAFEKDIDLGVMAVAIAQEHMGLGPDEILFGALGEISQHSTNQIVELPALQALWELGFPAGKKPKFDSRGRLVYVSVDLDKPPARIYSAGNAMVRSLVASPNDVEVNNSVVLRGLSHELKKVLSELQLLTEFESVTGFFDNEFKEDIYYSQDHSARAQDTKLVTKKKIRWSDADWDEIDEFHGRIDIDTRHLANVRKLIFGVWLAVQITVAIIDAFLQGDTSIALKALPGSSSIIAAVRFALQMVSLATMAALLWSMNFIGRGRYQVWGKPFEYVYQELVAQHELVGLALEERRQVEYRNDFVSTIEKLDELAEKHLRREVVKNQLFAVEVLDDPVLEVDDVIETANGDRYYIVSVQKAMRHDQVPILQLTCWKVRDGAIATQIEALELAEA